MTVTTTAARGTNPPSTFLRAALILQTLTLFAQSVTAGMLLTSPLAGEVHHAGSRVVYGATMLYVLAAVLAWRPGGGSPRPVLHATGFLLLASAQVVSGIAHATALHVPLGVVMFSLSTLDLARALSRRPLSGAARTAGGGSPSPAGARRCP
ncbi:hypothetical protein ACN6AT_00030 [Streptomyces sp. JL4002]|uniref:hypothetical protein n=1 Tax=Streptomyces TaxID=1883 RepID=UPI003B2869E2